MFTLVSGQVRRRMLLVVTLFVSILLHEIDVGHFPIIAAHSLSGALFPVIFLPLTLLALFVVQLRPTRAAELTVLVLSLANMAIGVLGFFFHLSANGITFAHLDKLFAFSLWSSPIGPNWPLSISFAGLFGIIAVLGAASDDAFIRSAPSGAVRFGRDLAFLGMLVAIVLTFWLGTFGVARTINVLAALLLGAIVAIDLATAPKENLASKKETTAR